MSTGTNKKRRWWWLLLLVPLIAAGLMRLRLETDILATLPQNLPEVEALKLLRDGFAGGSDLIIALEAEDDITAEETADALAAKLKARKDLVKEVQWAQSFTDQAASGAALIAWAMQNAEPAKVAALRKNLEGDGAKAQLRRSMQAVGTSLDPERVQKASYDPLGLLECLDTRAVASLDGSMFSLASEDGCFRLLMVTPASNVGNYKSAAAWLKQIREVIGTPEKVKVRLSGEPAFQAEIGAGIENDMSSTLGFTELLIALLFWVMFRRLKSLLWIQGLLMLSMAVTLALAGLLVGKLSIMSLGFAAIVMGIVVDYAVLIIQESRQHPDADSPTLRRLAGPGIIAGACTTATVFLSLLFSGLPGLQQLGLLVALGVLVGLAVMLGLAPPLAAGKHAAQRIAPTEKPASPRGAVVVTVLFLAGIAGVFALRGLPLYDTTAEALRPTKSESMDAFQWVQERLGRTEEASVPLLITGASDQLRPRAEKLTKILDDATGQGLIRRHTVPAMLVTDPSAQVANKATLEWLMQEQPRLEKAVEEAGFTENAMALLRGVTAVWKQALTGSWPQSPMSSGAAGVLSRLISEMPDAVLASVSVPGSPGHPDVSALKSLQAKLTDDTGARIAGWETLGDALSGLVKRGIAHQLLPIIGILLITLFITFRNARDIILSVLLLTTGLAALAATMTLAGVGWNIASLAAVPLLLGTGIDYGIHLLLALKRTNNNIREVQATTGRAVFFSGMTTVIGFGSLVFAGNRGIASLGLACCVGTLWILFVVLYLLPWWRAWLGAGKRDNG